MSFIAQAKFYERHTEFEELLFEDKTGFTELSREAREILLFLKEKEKEKRPLEERDEDAEEDAVEGAVDDVLLHFMFLKKAMEEVLVSISGMG
ncbi:hypothetical protein BGZ58_007392 [Dissophora ornata]|nr:hypothetical protein BGZ58_007392 [Dissophora ornata]